MSPNPQADRQGLARWQGAAFFSIALALAGAALFWAFTGGEGETAPATSVTLGMIDSNRPAVGEPAPDFALLSVQDGESVVRLSDFRGKPVVLNWYASWCGPCRAEVPEYQAAQDALGDQVVFLGVNLAESRETAASFLLSLGASYPALLDSDGGVADHYRLQGMPTSIFIDADGIVRSIWTGRVLGSQLTEELGRLGLVLDQS